MTNDLKNFLEGENERFYKEPVRELHLKEENADGSFSEQVYMHNWVKEHDTRLINFVLDLVEKEVGKLKRTDETQMNEDHVYDEALDDISTIINNLRV